LQRRGKGQAGAGAEQRDGRDPGEIAPACGALGRLIMIHKTGGAHARRKRFPRIESEGKLF